MTLAQLENWIWILFGKSTGFSPTPFLQQTAWKVDFLNGSNTADGTPAHPVKTAAEIRRRWNGGVAGVRPQLPPITIAIEIVANNPTPTTDPLGVLWDLDVSDGTVLDITVDSTVTRSGTINAVPNAFARTSTGQQTVTDLAVADWTPDVDQIIVDTTSGAVGWVTRGGATGTLSSTHAAVTTPDLFNGLSPAAIAATNAYQILALGQVYFGHTAQLRLAPGNPSANNPPSAIVIVRRAHDVAQNTSDFMHMSGDAALTTASIDEGASICFVECRIDQCRQTGGGVVFMNCAATAVDGASQDLITDPSETTYLLGGYGRHGILFGGGVVVDQDHFLLGRAAYGNITPFSDLAGRTVFGNVGRFLNPGDPATLAFRIDGPSSFIYGAFFDGTGISYGTTGGAPIIAVSEGAVVIANVTAGATWVFDGGAAATFRMSFQASAASWDQASAAFVGPTTLTVAHLDAPRAAGTGFGGNAMVPNVGTLVVNGAL